jgi:hypothetical protein
MSTTAIQAFIKTVNALPSAFDYSYWQMGDTSYKEELAITFIEENKISITDAEKMLYKIKLTKRDSPIVHLWLNKHVEQGMGMYVGITDYGKKRLAKLNGYQ